MYSEAVAATAASPDFLSYWSASTITIMPAGEIAQTITAVSFAHSSTTCN